MKSLQDKYTLIKEGKGNKELFIKEARTLFPNVVTGALTFDQAIHNLTERGIISENITGVLVSRKGEPNWFQIFNENTEAIKATLKDTDKSVKEKEVAGYDYEDKNNNNNISTAEILKGYYAEMKDPKNAEKTEEELKKIVFKNLEKDPMYYIKDGAFGIKGIGYTEDAPGLGTTKEITGKYKSSGMEPVKLNESKNNTTSKKRVVKKHLTEMENTNTDAEALRRKADAIYDLGHRAYTGKDYSEADRLRNRALTLGQDLGLGEAEFPPYDKLAYVVYTYPYGKPEEKTLYQDNMTARSAKGTAFTYNMDDDSERFGYMKQSEWEKEYGPTREGKTVSKDKNRETLSEAKKRAIEKHLKEIEKLGEVAAYEYKATKIQEKIEELKNKITMTESDDVKEMVDKNAIKEIKKDIALLEKRKKMYEAKKAQAAKRVSGDATRPKAAGGEEIIDEAKEKTSMWQEAMKTVLKKKGY